MFTGNGVELAPPPLGFNTVTEAVPAVATSAAGTAARNSVLDSRVVDRAVPFHWITASDAKVSPLAVKMVSPLPAVTMLGNTEVKVRGGTGAIVKFTAFETGAVGFE
jgi:hypothetical protein